MKLPSSAREGYKPRKPKSSVLKKLLPKEAKPLGKAVADWAKAAKLQTGTVAWSSMDDDEVRGAAASDDTLVGLGVPAEVAPRVCAKINGLLSAQAQ